MISPFPGLTALSESIADVFQFGTGSCKYLQVLKEPWRCHQQAAQLPVLLILTVT